MMRHYKLILIPVVIAFAFMAPYMYTQLVSGEDSKSGEPVSSQHKNKNTSIITLEQSDDITGTAEDDSIFEELSDELGRSVQTVRNERGTPAYEGDYEGGPYYAYGDATYFTSYGSDEVVAVAVSAENLSGTEADEFDLLKKNDPVISEWNNRNGLWMEIYELDTFDVMIERESESHGPLYIWFTKSHLFSE